MKKRLTASAMALTMALSLAACGGGGSNTATSTAQQAASTAAAEVSQAAEQADGLSAEALANVNETIAADSYDAMSALAKDIQNGAKTGQVVQIDGVVSNMGAGMSYSIGQNDANGSNYRGTKFVIEGAEESAYPKDGTHVKVTGLIAQDGATFYIQTLPEFVEVLD